MQYETETNLQAQGAKGCHISWKWSLPLLPENLKKSFQFNSNLLPNRIGPRKTCFWWAPRTSFTPPPAVWVELQTLQRVADEPVGRTGCCWWPGSCWPSIDICWLGSPTTNFGLSWRKLQRVGLSKFTYSKETWFNQISSMTGFMLCAQFTRRMFYWQLIACPSSSTGRWCSSQNFCGQTWQQLA